MTDVWRELERPGPRAVVVDGVEVRAGSRVRLRPHARRDAWDTLLAGKTGRVERIEESVEGGCQVVVSLSDSNHPAHQFFFAPEEVEPVTGRRVLVAGIGNLFLGDDGFGCAVAAGLADAPLPEGVDVADFGIRGMDLAYALRDYDAVVLVDAAPRGERPGTLTVLEADLDAEEAAIETHAMDPLSVLRLARDLGDVPERTLVVACEPERVADPRADEVVAELTPTVSRAVEQAVPLVRSLVEELVEERPKGGAA